MLASDHSGAPREVRNVQERNATEVREHVCVCPEEKQPP